MYASKPLSEARRRRGAVLVLVLGMLGLLALIGVAFATFSGQARSSARVYSLKMFEPDPDKLFEYAMDQLINDTSNPMSDIRGHGIKRDMYGNDAFNNGHYTENPDGSAPQILQILDNGLAQTPAWVRVRTNIPLSGGHDFTRWILRLPGTATTVSQTFEVTLDDQTTAPNHILTLIGPHRAPIHPIGNVGMTAPFVGARFELDGRFRNAFNGPGLEALNSIVANNMMEVGNSNAAQFANFRLSGGILTGRPTLARSFNVNAIGMDEDYDAPDLENWYLAVQSADGQVVIPSFHRPGILTAEDWQLRPQINYQDPDNPNAVDNSLLQYRAVRAASKFLRPRAVDHPVAGQETFPDLTPDPTTGRITYDVDNDGDGVPDAVWVDLGHPPKRGADGRYYKPLYAFTVLGMNGRIPLNTAGNLNARNPFDDLIGTPTIDEAGLPLFDHASHLGTSPSEINPKYALQNGPPTDPNTSDRNQTANQQFDTGEVRVELTQLRNILAGTRLPVLDNQGNFVSEGNAVLQAGEAFAWSNNVLDNDDFSDNRPGQAIAGRWGEPDSIPDFVESFYNNFVRAGKSPQYTSAGFRYNVDGTDTDYDTYDFHPPGSPELHPISIPPANSQNLVFREQANYLDASGSLVLPSERIRRYVTPHDPTGNGVKVRYGIRPDTFFPFGYGPDRYGRVSFFHYFRPPGISPDIINEPAGGNPSYEIGRNFLNIYRGYESFRNPETPIIDPTQTNGDPFSGRHMAGMPYNLSNTGAVPIIGPGGNQYFVPNPPTNLYDNAGGYIGTFNGSINTGSLVPDATLVGNHPVAPDMALQAGLPQSSLLWNDPGEMDLYTPRKHDAPYGPTDLAYLYSSQDFDGRSHRSRLSDLAPISFEHPTQGLMRRRLFTTDTWDRHNFVFAHDNPTTGVGNNFRFPIGFSASLQNEGVPTPQLAHGDRKINLNFPFPHSYDPQEPVRQKWISETYQLLKRVLPPQAVDTPQELAKLGQFVVNIVDFRDPDNTITIWRNPDVWHQPARRVGTEDRPPSIHLEFLADGITNDGEFGVAPGENLIHYGMEYQPVAISEVLAFQFNFANPAKVGQEDRNTKANRMFVELYNMLSKAAETYGQDVNGDDIDNPSDLDLKGWDFVLAHEGNPTAITFDPNAPYNHPVYVRPDPTTGQVPQTSGILPPIMPDNATDYVTNQSAPVVVGSGKWGSPVDPNTNEPTGGLDPAAYTQGLNNKVQSIRYDPDGSNPGYRTGRHVIGGYRFEDNPANPNPAGDPTADPPVPADANWNRNRIERSRPEVTTTYGGPGINVWDLIPPTDHPAFANTGGGHYFWLYLRRPANPLLPPDPTINPITLLPNNPMVVVDSIRFPFSVSEGTGRTVVVNQNTGEERDRELTPAAQPIYSIERPQPYRGGQLVPDPEDGNVPLYIYGTSEQARPSTQSGNNSYRGRYDIVSEDPLNPSQDTNQEEDVFTTVGIRQSIGSGNNVSDDAWDYLAFNDRDFTSVAELLMVPGSPPGLFTKQFAENSPPLPLPAVPDFVNGVAGAFYVTPPEPHNGDTWQMVPRRSSETPGLTRPFSRNRVHPHPYLPHEFYYTAEPTSEAPPIPNSFRVVGGSSGAGWHRMFEFLEVPSTNLGAIGPVEQGQNFDWYREDTRPGQINLNLVIDEEVFFGVVDEPRLNVAFVPNGQEPRIVTQVTRNGTPAASYRMPNRGFTYFDDVGNGIPNEMQAIPPGTSPDSIPRTGMKLAFADFLKQRHGGTGYLFGFGSGDVGTPYRNSGSGDFNPLLAHDRPYRSLSYFDIQGTLMRPATMEPSVYTFAPDGTALTTYDPGRKEWAPDGFLPNNSPRVNSFYSSPQYATGAPIVPPVPPRRFFQVPDSEIAVTNTDTDPNTGVTTTTTTISHSNASIDADPDIHAPIVNFNPNNDDPPVPHFPMSGNIASLIRGWPSGAISIDPNTPNSRPHMFLLGNEVVIDDTTVPPTAYGAPGDMDETDTRRHPYYRSEMLQKVMNLTTPRTHQYAVWVTVGLFEVVEPGDPSKLIPDRLGPEIGRAEGRNQRYRYFAVVDRTKAIGFNPRNPRHFRELVPYFRRIE